VATCIEAPSATTSVHSAFFVQVKGSTKTSGTSQGLCSPLEGISQQYALPWIVITVVLDPSLPIAA
jgi:hypothetical protein